MCKCQDCSYSTKRSYDLRRHVKAMHKAIVEHKSNVYTQPTNTDTNPNDIRLKENF